MIFIDDNIMKVGGITLPGLFKSIEVGASALVDEQQVEGQPVKPKQLTGYSDAKVTLELTLSSSKNQTAAQKLTKIQNLFRKPSQAKPKVLPIVNSHTAARGVKKVIFKDLTTKEQSGSDSLTVTIEFWEYVPSVVVSKKKSTKNSSSKKSGTKNSKGAASKQSNKTSKSPTQHSNTTESHYANKMKALFYGG